MRDLAQPCMKESRAAELSCVKGWTKGGVLLRAAVPPRRRVPRRHCRSVKILRAQVLSELQAQKACVLRGLILCSFHRSNVREMDIAGGLTASASAGSLAEARLLLQEPATQGMTLP